VVLAARAVIGTASATASSKATGRTKSLRDALDDPLLIDAATAAACGLLEAMTSVRVMPTSR
jgi:hypothetical protein